MFPALPIPLSVNRDLALSTRTLHRHLVTSYSAYARYNPKVYSAQHSGRACTTQGVPGSGAKSTDQNMKERTHFEMVNHDKLFTFFSTRMHLLICINFFWLPVSVLCVRTDN